jgi:hypothetical protein
MRARQAGATFVWTASQGLLAQASLPEHDVDAAVMAEAEGFGLLALQARALHRRHAAAPTVQIEAAR